MSFQENTFYNGQHEKMNKILVSLVKKKKENLGGLFIQVIKNNMVESKFCQKLFCFIIQLVYQYH